MNHQVGRGSFIIVTYNSESVIAGCLAPLVDLALAGHEVIIVDNNSHDETLTICAKLIPTAKIIRNPNNDGFAKAVNIGVAASAGSTIVLLNPDAVGTAESFNQLLKSSAESPRAVIAPMIVHPEHRLSVVSAGRQPKLRRMILHYSGLARLAGPRFLEGHYLYPHQAKSDRNVEWATGACLVIPKDLWLAVGGLTERWFMYAEDIEFCHRVVSAGYTVRLLPGIEISHAAGTGTSEPKSMKADWIVNLWHFYNDDLSPSRAASSLWKFVVSAGLLSRAAYYALRAVTPGDKLAWLHESRRFRAFSTAMLRAK
ncbi:glycosyltransferase family 2 protein [Paenarthrobacter nitroguajacolicus]|uniref:glycosyltransferase family 2 protein n=1 Tax=Paenarthrobacter nitroguajacolicus TaxID=211146 RepID=UPI0015BB26FC|nr:glycosyltransferase family 2 protein [Paenarthrobacter nitroguajacolicus]NWL35198.1 glycosyl transferase [Paenarthrobacter nitroguajacolicus]